MSGYMLIQFGAVDLVTRLSLISQKMAVARALHENLASDWLIGTVWFVGGSKISGNVYHDIKNRMTTIRIKNVFCHNAELQQQVINNTDHWCSIPSFISIYESCTFTDTIY